MNTEAFSTRSEYKEKNNTKASGLHIIGLDAPKCVHENRENHLPLILQRNSSFVVTDPKGELSESLGLLTRHGYVVTDPKGELSENLGLLTRHGYDVKAFNTEPLELH